MGRLGGELSKIESHRWHGWSEQRFVDARVVERCAYCGFEVAAPGMEAREAFAGHECERPKPWPKPGPNGGP